MARLTPVTETLKRLFARSGNKCAFPGCNRLLFKEDGTFIAQICHIEGVEEEGERYNAGQTDEQRREIGNLLVMCHEHHKITDDVKTYTVDRMRQIKAEHEAKYGSEEFIVTDITLEKIVGNLLSELSPMLDAALQPLQDMMKQLLKISAPLPSDAPEGLKRIIQKIQEDEPGIKVEAHTTSTGTSFIIRPASPDKSVTIADVSFPGTEAGRRGLEKFRRAIETGCDVEILPDEHLWEPKISLPSALLPARAVPHVLQIQPNSFLRQHLPLIPVQVTCYAVATSEVIAHFGFARLQILRYGTKEVEFRLAGGQLGADFTFTHQFDHSTSVIQFELDLSKVKPIYAIETLKIFEAMENKVAIRFSIVSLDVDAPLIEGQLTSTNSALALENILFTKVLLNEICEINKILGLELRYPVSPSPYLGMELKLIYGLITGKTVIAKANQQPIPMSINCAEAHRLLDTWEKGQAIDIPLPEPPVFSVAGSRIDIPGASVVLCEIRPARMLEEFASLVKACTAPDQIIKFEVTCHQFAYHPPESNKRGGP